MLDKVKDHIQGALHRDRDEEPSGGGHHYEPSPDGHKSYKHHEDRNQINQADEHYRSLRDRASQEGDMMAQAFQRSHEVYESGDGAEAKNLSNEGKAHEHKMEQLNEEASEWIFAANNRDMPRGEVNLHGLYVKEAIHYTERAINDAQSRGDHTIELVVGKGIHSPQHIAKIKPAIEDLMQKYNLLAELEPNNSGVLIVHLDGHGNGRESSDRRIGPDGIAQRLEKKQSDGPCLIM